MSSSSDNFSVTIYLYVNRLYILAGLCGVFLLGVVLQLGIMVYISGFLLFLGGLIILYDVYFRNPHVFSKKSGKHKKHNKQKDNPVKTPEVFQVSNNLFTYDSAQEVCKAYDGRLATYQDMDNAYKSGADWCTYGWAQDQYVFFPTQQQKYDKLRKIPGHENDCGHPGVNGGYVKDKTKLFGATCYGIKPDATDDELLLMKVMPTDPVTESDKSMEEKLSYWKANKSNLLLFPFNGDKWHSYTRA